MRRTPGDLRSPSPGAVEVFDDGDFRHDAHRSGATWASARRHRGPGRDLSGAGPSLSAWLGDRPDLVSGASPFWTAPICARGQPGLPAPRSGLFPIGGRRPVQRHNLRQHRLARPTALAGDEDGAAAEDASGPSIEASPTHGHPGRRTGAEARRGAPAGAGIARALWPIPACWCWTRPPAPLDGRTEEAIQETLRR